MLLLTLTLAAGCFTDHVDEALASAEAARARYDEATNGASLPLSAQLIALEHAMWPLAATFDAAAEAERVEERWCTLFVPTSPPAPAPAHAVPAGHARPTSVLRPDASLGAMLWQHASAQDLARVDALTRGAVTTLDEGRDCMARHILEAMTKTAMVAAEAPHGRDLFVAMMLLQASSIPGALAIDDAARPLQEAGVPIVCAEVPSIL